MIAAEHLWNLYVWMIVVEEPMKKWCSWMIDVEKPMKNCVVG